MSWIPAAEGFGTQYTRRNEMSTPCQDKGYEVGQVFELDRSDGCFDEGDIVVLILDSGTHSPRFEMIKGHRKGEERHLILNVDVKRIYPPEEESKDVTVTCEGKETIISRKSARKLNLIWPANT